MTRSADVMPAQLLGLNLLKLHYRVEMVFKHLVLYCSIIMLEYVTGQDLFIFLPKLTLFLPDHGVDFAAVWRPFGYSHC